MGVLPEWGRPPDDTATRGGVPARRGLPGGETRFSRKPGFLEKRVPGGRRATRTTRPGRKPLPGLARRVARSGWVYVKRGSAPWHGCLFEGQRPDVVADDLAFPLALAGRALEDDHFRPGHCGGEQARVALGQQVARPVAAQMGTTHPVTGQHDSGLRWVKLRRRRASGNLTPLAGPCKEKPEKSAKSWRPFSP